MSRKFLLVARFGLLASVAACGVNSTAQAATATLTDNYIGGLDTYNNPPGDIIGPASVFNILSANVSLTATNLTVTINTNFAGVPGTPNADGTTYGSLFIGSAATWTSDHSSQSAPYPTDQYHPGEWTYAVVANGTTTGSSDGLYAISGAETAHIYGSGVPDYYTTSTGNVIMSNVNGDPITYPGSGNPGYYFRQGQAVGFSPTGNALSSGGLLSVVNGTSVTYSVNINTAVYDTLENGFSLSWAMTCANDIIQGTVDFPGGNGGTGPNPTPLPAALPLFTAGLGFLGFVSSRRRKSSVKTIVAV